MPQLSTKIGVFQVGTAAQVFRTVLKFKVELQMADVVVGTIRSWIVTLNWQEAVLPE